MGVASRLVALRKKKVYLQEFCTSVLCQLLERCSADVCRDIMPVLELDGGWDDSTPETLQILLSLSNLCCKVQCTPASLKGFGIIQHVIHCFFIRRCGSNLFYRLIGIIKTFVTM